MKIDENISHRIENPIFEHKNVDTIINARDIVSLINMKTLKLTFYLLKYTAPGYSKICIYNIYRNVFVAL